MSAFVFSIVLLKRLVAWFYQLKLNKTSIKLKVLREEKKKIIEKVMDTETYKVTFKRIKLNLYCVNVLTFPRWLLTF